MKPTVFKFMGMNNVDDPSDLDPAKGECVDLVNVDTDNDGNISDRSATITGLVQQPVGDVMFGRTYFAVGNKVYCTKALDDTEVDERYKTVIALDDMITVVKRTDAGLWVASTTEIHFLAGSDPQVGGFQDKHVKSYGAILGTAITIDGSKVPAAGVSGTCCIMASHQGVCVGDSAGNLINLSERKVSYSYGQFGKAMVREENGLIHYLFTTSATMPANNPFVPLNFEMDSI